MMALTEPGSRNLAVPPAPMEVGVPGRKTA